MTLRFWAVPALLLTLTAATRAAEHGPAFLEPSEAGPDYPVQGEYLNESSAAQVIALGEGKFHIVGWSKGLPGVAFDAEKKIELDAQREGTEVTFNHDGWQGRIVDGTITGSNQEGATVTLTRTERHSPTEGTPPPAGAMVLFSGEGADAWEGGKVDDRHLLAGGTKTKQAFQDFLLHVEFRTPFMPDSRGQARGNSGVYLQNRYECQVLDSFGLKGEDNEAGGVYHVSKPLLNMCYPPLTWQTYDIDFQAARYDAAGAKTKNAVLTLKHNGVVVQEHLEIPAPTPGAGLKETAEPGPILLQNHGNPVFFRNIWIVEKK